MAGFAEYERYDGLGLAGLVQARHVTPEELLEAAIARVEARNPLVNALTMPLYDLARRAIGAGLPDGPFRGVPFLMKDLTLSEAAEILQISISTANQHIALAKKAFNTSTIHGALLCAIKEGLLEL